MPNALSITVPWNNAHECWRRYLENVIVILRSPLAYFNGTGRAFDDPQPTSRRAMGFSVKRANMTVVALTLVAHGDFNFFAIPPRGELYAPFGIGLILKPLMYGPIMCLKGLKGSPLLVVDRNRIQF